MLLANANQVVSRDRLIDALWEDAPPPTAAGSLHNLVSGVRRAVGDALVTRDGGYVLHVMPGECDAERFAALAERGSVALAAGDAERADAILREALALWRGPPLGDLAGDRALADEAARLVDAWLVALEDRTTPIFSSAATTRSSESSRRSPPSTRCGSGCMPRRCSRCTGRAARPRR